MKASTPLKLAGLAVVVGLAYAGYRLGWSVIEPKIEKRVEQIGLTSNQIAANGPLPGDVSLYAKELACQQQIPTPGYYSSLNGAEFTDSERSGIFPCASFLGSFDGPNQVYAWRSADEYQATAYINNRKPGEIIIAGGANPPLKGLVPAGPFVAKADATTGKEIWRTYLDNVNLTGRWLAAVNLNILPDGNVVFAWETSIAILDGETGLILKHNTLPTGATAPGDSGFKHVTIAPDGTIIAKSQTRAVGYEGQGTLAIIKGVQAGFKQPPSHLVAVDPATLQVLDDLQLPEPATVPHSIAMLDDKIAIYLGVNSGALRYFWDPVAKKLSQDESWVVDPMQKGQSTSDAPSIMGEWIILQTNGIGSKEVASSIVAVHTRDAARRKVIFPFGELKKGQWSFAPPKPQTDPENNMVYSADMGLGKVAGISFDPASGDMKVAWVVDNLTTAFQPLIGPKDKRIVMLSNMKPNVAKEPIELTMFTGNYKEQVNWRDAATGRIIAESDYFQPMTFGSLITPGYGGRFYFSSNDGFIVLQVMPKAQSASGK